MAICPEIDTVPPSSSTSAASTRYLLKNDLGYLKRPYAELEEFVEERASVSGVATRMTSSPNLERQVRALVRSSDGKSLRAVHKQNKRARTFQRGRVHSRLHETRKGMAVVVVGRVQTRDSTGARRVCG